MMSNRKNAKSFDYKLENETETEEKIHNKKNPVLQIIQSFCFVAVGGLLLYFSDIVNILLSKDDRLIKVPLYFGTLATIGYLLIFLYLVFYLNARKGIPIEYKVLQSHSPYLIPTATALMVSSGILFTISFYPIFNIFTPFLLFGIFLGFVALFSLF